jgi:PAS domain S-box-containing protein
LSAAPTGTPGENKPHQPDDTPRQYNAGLEGLTMNTSLLSLVNNSTDYMGLSDREGNMIYINRAGRGLLGLMPDEDVSTLHASNFFTPRDFQTLNQEIIPAIIKNSRWKGTIRLRHFLTGEIIPCDASYMRMDDPATGQYIGRGVTLRDLRPEIAARHALATSEQQLRSAVDLAQLGTWRIDLLNMDVIFSEKAKELFGFTGPSIDFNTGIQAIHEKDRDRVLSKLQKSLNPKSAGLYEDTYNIRNLVTGRENTVHVNGKVSFNEKGEAYLLTGTLQDVTELKLIERELEQQVQIRTEELKKTNTHLSRTNQELEQFAFVASHDLQEPLRKIRTYSGLLEETGKDILTGPALGYLAKIKAASERMSRLITDLLDFSRVSSKKELWAPVDLNQLLAKIEEDFELVVRQKQAIIRAQQLPVIEAVPLQINQLFYNLIGNALKFSREGQPPVIQITAKRISAWETRQFPELDPRRVYWAINIADNGIGFAPSLAEKVFTIFQRLNSRDHYEGTGIGLALCKKIVAAHGGIIYATALPMTGATFHILLPIKHS